MRLEDIDFTR